MQNSENVNIPPNCAFVEHWDMLSKICLYQQLQISLCAALSVDCLQCKQIQLYVHTLKSVLYFTPQARKWGSAIGYVNGKLTLAGGGDYGDNTIEVSFYIQKQFCLQKKFKFLPQTQIFNL